MRIEVGIDPGDQVFDDSKIPLVLSSGAQVVRLNFIGPLNNRDAAGPFMGFYRDLARRYVDNGVKVLGLIGMQSVEGGYQDPNAFPYQIAEAADVITDSTGGVVGEFEVINEPNNYYGGSSHLIPPDYFAWNLSSVYRRIKMERGRRDLSLISGPVLGHDFSGDLNEDSGANYMWWTCHSGINVFAPDDPNNWERIRQESGDYPLGDKVGAHLYVVQGNSSPGIVSQAVWETLQAFKRGYQWFGINKPVSISEIGCQSDAVGMEGQRDNVDTYMRALDADPDVTLGMWFCLRDFNNESWGLLHGDNTEKLAMQRFREMALVA